MPMDRILLPIDSPGNVVDPGGLKNSTSGVQVAINQIKAAGGGRLIVPPGSYRLNSSGVVNNFQTAVKIDFGNVEILAQNPNDSPLFFTDETFTGPPGNATTLFQFHIPGGGSAFSQLKLTNLKFRGPLLTSDTQFPPGDADYALVLFYGQAWNQRLSYISVQNCQFTDPVRYAMAFEYVTTVSVVNCAFNMYSRYAYDDIFKTLGNQSIVVALFSSVGGIDTATVSDCQFNGRVKPVATDNPPPPPPPPPQLPYNPAAPPTAEHNTRYGADGFVFFQKGGNISVLRNMIRRYYLEDVQTNAGPSYVTDNVFDTPFSQGVAYMAYADTNNTTPGPTPYILQRLYHFKRNTVNGGSLAVKFAGISYPQLPTENEAPQITGVVENNTSIRLNTQTYQPYTLGVFAGGADSVTVKNNTFHDCGMMFHAAIDPGPEVDFVLTDFRCREILIEDNQFLQNGENNKPYHCIFFQFPLRNNGVPQIGRNTLVRRSVNYAHIRLGGTNLPKKSKLPKTPPQQEYPPLPPVGQIEIGKTCKVYVPPGQTGHITYGGVNYTNDAEFTGSPSGISYFQTTGAAQVRLKTSAPSSYVAKIGTSATNKNTYVTQGSSSTNPDNRFIYYEPSDNSVKEANAMPPNPPQDGVSVQEY